MASRLLNDGNTSRYELTGLIICGLCGRRMEGHWAHGRARYRCRHGPHQRQRQRRRPWPTQSPLRS
ncbi:zinc ribbon domain-containing protein [Actinoplanes sp. NPDC049316]|uniref:zinc ribbon domain-containing protein n=1 Tax=Actinoplanes sp. NPDC049316 TaxID=3154727 RepID=UPI0034436E67